MDTSLMTLLFVITTAIISFWKFRSERWWELKVKTYARIMESLHYIKKYNDLDYEQFNESSYQASGLADLDKSKERQSLIRKSMALIKNRRDEALQEIEKTIDVSSFIISANALNELIRLKDEYMQGIDDEDIEVYVENEKVLVDACVKNVRICAKRDLETFPNMLMDVIKKCWNSILLLK